MKRIEELRTTTNSRVYKCTYGLIHKGCPFCAWHPDFYHNWCENDDGWKTYAFEEEAATGRRLVQSGALNSRHRFPSWKLVSKNRKQWMKKPLKHMRYKNNGNADGERYIQVHIEW
ncbi:hypothetical protein F0L74_20880 [Chitinophaga agrisoli]|uniref:Uncharacterized protein n=1 Tax=Chitinophaga agrisoli TaxID=2607653 RepID=A0A5B2VJG3_9BACT|nr:hypothetical protein [Chitinophaga agrisoli]KAA2238676.1 hypothetical protein F0L74_20880 [Chitinophaga agrisoli]